MKIHEVPDFGGYRERAPERFDPPKMLGFARGMKSIRSALLNLVELGPGTRQIGPISQYISTHQLHSSHFQLMMPTTKLIKKL